MDVCLYVNNVSVMTPSEGKVEKMATQRRCVVPADTVEITMVLLNNLLFLKKK